MLRDPPAHPNARRTALDLNAEPHQTGPACARAAMLRQRQSVELLPRLRPDRQDNAHVPRPMLAREPLHLRPVSILEHHARTMNGHSPKNLLGELLGRNHPSPTTSRPPNCLRL